MKLVGVALLAVALAAPVAASAETIHAPAPSAAFAEGQVVHFDWRWDDDQYATVALIFTRNPNGHDPVWFGPAAPDKIRVTDNYGLGFDLSNTNVVPSKWGITPGLWYWRPCSKSIHGEDDKCYQRVEPRAITIVADPPAPAPPPPAPPVAPPVPAPPVPAAPTLSREDAAKKARSEIRRRLRLKRTPTGLTTQCKRRSPRAQRCTVRWRTRAYAWRGTVHVEADEIDGTVSAGLEVARTNRKTGRKRYFAY